MLAVPLLLASLLARDCEDEDRMSGCYDIAVDSCESVTCPGGTALAGCDPEDLEAVCCVP